MTETKAHLVTATTLKRNTLFVFIGQVIVAVSALVTVPAIVRGMGFASYGLLSIALMIFGSFSLLELGLGRATTKFVAEHLSRREFEKISAVVWTSVIVQIVIGVVGGLILAASAQLLVRQMKLPQELVSDAETMMYILASSAPIVLGSAALRGALEGSQRFDLLNYVKVTLNISTYLIPLVGVKNHLSIPSIVILMLIARCLAALAYLFFCIYTLPQIKKFNFISEIRIVELFSYAGWVALSNLVVPFLVQIDRYFIASFVAISAVAFYAIPYEILNGLWIIPGSIAAVLFPAFSGIRHEDSNIPNLFIRPIKYILISLGPSVFIIYYFSYDILLLWQGSIIAEASSTVLKILIIGVLINSLSWVPSNFIMGFGRPDITAKIHLIQVPFYLLTAYLFILKWGIIGASAAFLLRVLLETILSYSAVFTLNPSLRKSFIAGTG